MRPTLKILGSRIVMFWHGAGDDRGRPSQVTHVQLAGRDAYVREGLRTNSLDHFVMSSGARLGHKADGNRVPGREILELAAERGTWHTIAAAVLELDTMKREVRRNSRWSFDDARRLWLDGTTRTHW